MTMAVSSLLVLVWSSLELSAKVKEQTTSPLVPGVPAISDARLTSGTASTLPPDAIPVEVEKVTQLLVQPALFFEGISSPAVFATISAKVNGRIENFAINEGTFLDEGEMICQIDRTQYLNEFNQAKAELDKAQANLAKLQTGYTEEEINLRRADVTSWKAILEKIKADKSSRQDEQKNNGLNMPKPSWDEEYDYNKVLAKLQFAQAALSVALKGYRYEDKLAAKAEVDSLTSKFDRAQENLANTTLTVPFKGAIIKKYKQSGEWVKAGEALVDVAGLENILVKANFLEKDISKIRQGQRAQVLFEAYPETEFTGMVREIIPQVNPKTQTFPVTIEVSNPQHKLYAGMRTKIKLNIGGPEKLVALVPKKALIYEADAYYVCVVKDGLASKVKVNVLQSRDEMSAEVEGPLQDGDLVAVSNTDKLHGKNKVKFKISQLPARTVVPPAQAQVTSPLFSR